MGKYLSTQMKMNLRVCKYFNKRMHWTTKAKAFGASDACRYLA